MGIIYCHKNKINRKCYIGQTSKTIQERVGNNPSKSYKNNHEFSSDIIKYGWENFETNILEVVDDDNDLNSRETYWINRIKETNGIYNKYTRGTNNSKQTPLLCNRVKDFEIPQVLELFDLGYCMTDIGLKFGYSINTIKNILSKNGRTSSGCGELNIVQKRNKERIYDYIKTRRCLICGNNVYAEKNIHINKLVCSRECVHILLTMNKEERERIKEERNKFIQGYKTLLDDCEKIELEYKENRLNEYKNVKETKIKEIRKADIRKIELRRKKKELKRTAKDLYWHKDEERCKQKLDLILNSGVDLMKFGYNAKLCRMFPELNKKTILFLLRKYKIPHFERSSSKNHIAR